MNTTLPSSPLWNDETRGAGDYYERLDAGGAIRPQWQLLSERFESLGASCLSERSRSIEQFIRENGVTFHADDQPESLDRPWQLSVLPFVIRSSEWQSLRDGLVARTRLLEEVLQDLLGPQRLIRERVIPDRLLWCHPHFYRAYHSLGGTRPKLHVVATDLARGSDGIWRVTGDRTRAPSGLGYLLENRIVISRVLPTLIRQSKTLRLASFFESLQQHLRSLAPADRDNPRVALLTPPSGSYREFEDTYLARYLGITLIQGSDLAVREGRLNLKTLGGLQPIQVLWRHISDRRCDPRELDPRSSEGVTGMLDCVRRESVAVVNSIGSVLAQTPALMPYLDAAHEFFHGGSLPLPASETYWCGDAEHLAYVLEHADRLIFRNAMSVSSQPAKTTAGMTDEQRQAFLAELKEQPEDYVAHQPLPYSRTPVWSAGQIRSPKVALRTFQLLTEGDVQVLPGGLARVGQDELELSRSPVIGQMTLDCWVTSDTPIEEHQSLLPDSDAPIRLRRSGDELPSRVAEHLYWLGRYAERAEGIARALRTTLSRIAGEEDWGSRPEIRRLVYALASMGQIEASFAVDSFAANMPQVEQTLPDSILDRDQPRGLIRTMDSVMHNATAVRDRLSVDAYRIVGRAYQELKAPVSAVSASAPSRVSIDQAIERVGTLVVDLLALAGVFSESFVRTHAWQFLELGRRIERADQLCDLLATTLCPATKDGKAICLAVLETTDSSMTYRSRYLNLVRLAAVIDLLVTDETNPRSLRFQLDRITELMEQLPSVEGPVGLDAIQRIVLDMQYHVTTADPTGLAQPAEDGKLQTLDALLRRVSESLPRLSEGINARYLIHTEAQQFLTGTGR